MIDAVRKHRGVASALEGRGRVVTVERHLAARDGPADQAVVGVYDYVRDRTLVATVDVARGRVLAVDDSPALLQLGEEERAEAEALAAGDERVRRFLRRRRMRPLTRLYFHREGPRHRYAIVFLRPTTSERAYAVVDLSEQRVVDVLSHAQFTD